MASSSKAADEPEEVWEVMRREWLHDKEQKRVVEARGREHDLDDEELGRLVGKFLGEAIARKKDTSLLVTRRPAFDDSRVVQQEAKPLPKHLIAATGCFKQRTILTIPKSNSFRPLFALFPRRICKSAPALALVFVIRRSSRSSSLRPITMQTTLRTTVTTTATAATTVEATTRTSPTTTRTSS